MFFSPSAVESYLSNNKIKRNLLLHWQYNGFGIRSKKIKNIVIPEIPTVEDVIIEVIQHYKPMPEEGN
jgi:uroporphyrinogen-III synthase